VRFFIAVLTIAPGIKFCQTLCRLLWLGFSGAYTFTRLKYVIQ
jgi:hypothetical protein